MYFKKKGFTTKWSKTPSDAPDQLNKHGRPSPAWVLEQIGESEDKKWLNLRYVEPVVSVQYTGWLKKTDLTEVPAPERPEIDLWTFLKTCVRAEHSVNGLPVKKGSDPFYINSDYLVALALYETKISNPIKGKKDPATGEIDPETATVGPFQVTAERWQYLLDTVSPKPAEENSDFLFTTFQRDNYTRQTFGVALLTWDDCRLVSEGVTKHEKDKGTNPEPGKTGNYIPTYADLFIASLAGPAAAVKLRTLEIDGKGDTVIQTLVDALPDDRKEALEKAFRANFHIFNIGENEAKSKGIAAGPRTVKELYEKVEAKLDDFLSQAFKLMEENIPEDIAIKKIEDGGWWQIAVNEFNGPWKQGTVDEKTAEGTAKVIEYFKKTDLKPTPTTAIAWCGAFAAYCTSTAHAPVVKTAARAASWKQWGNVNIPVKSTSIPPGAIVVLSPPPGNTARSGHVSFYNPDQNGVKKGNIRLLGGNQGNTVKNSEYESAKVVAIRWNNREGIGASTSTIAALRPLLDLIGKPESRNNYNAYFGKINNKTNPEFTAMTVSQVLKWQDDFVAGGSRSSAVGWYQIIRGTLRHLVKSQKLTGNELFDPAHQDRLGVALLNGRGLQKFLRGQMSKSDFAHELSKEWASFPRAKGANPEISFYAGDGLNKAHVSVAEVFEALDQILALHQSGG